MKGALARAALTLLAWLPWRALRWLGNWLGRLLYRLDGREGRNVRANLLIAYPQMSQVEREDLAKQALQESGITYAEFPRIWLRGGGDRVDPNGLPERMWALAEQGQGLILAMPHHGNWELVSSGVHPDLPITGLYRPPRQAWLEPLMTAGRQTSKIRMVATDRRGIKALHATLRAGEVVAILPDQVPKAAGAAAANAPFFGRLTPTMTLLGRLAAKRQAPVLMVWAERQAGGRYRLQHFLVDSQVAEKDGQKSAAILNQAVERCIATSPAQYQWAYRRFLPIDETQDNPYH